MIVKLHGDRQYIIDILARANVVWDEINTEGPIYPGHKLKSVFGSLVEAVPIEKIGVATDNPTGTEVNHPVHYNQNPSGVECITIVEHLSFNIGNAIKYLWRAGHKGDMLADFRKAIWYINREVSRVGDIKPNG